MIEIMQVYNGWKKNCEAVRDYLNRYDFVRTNWDVDIVKSTTGIRGHANYRVLAALKVEGMKIDAVTALTIHRLVEIFRLRGFLREDDAYGDFLKAKPLKTPCNPKTIGRRRKL